MDAVLVAEVHRLHDVAAKHGLQHFRLKCLESWIAPLGATSRSLLFRACTPSGREQQRSDGQLCGCLVEVRYPQYPTGPRIAWLDEWTEGIRSDSRIPETMGEILPEQLSAFAEWQQVMRDHFRKAQEAPYPGVVLSPVT